MEAAEAARIFLVMGVVGWAAFYSQYVYGGECNHLAWHAGDGEGEQRVGCSPIPTEVPTPSPRSLQLS